MSQPVSRVEWVLLLGCGLILGAAAGTGILRALVAAPEAVRAGCSMGGDCGCNSPKGCDMPCTGCCPGADPKTGCPPPPTRAQ